MNIINLHKGFKRCFSADCPSFAVTLPSKMAEQQRLRGRLSITTWGLPIYGVAQLVFLGPKQHLSSWRCQKHLKSLPESPMQKPKVLRFDPESQDVPKDAEDILWRSCTEIPLDCQLHGRLATKGSASLPGLTWDMSHLTYNDLL